MALLGITSSSSPYSYAKLLEPLQKEVEAREKKMDEIDTLETSLSALNNYLEGESSDDPIIKQYYGMQKDAENLSEKWAKGEINDKQLRDKIKSIKATYSKTVPILSEAIKNRQEALRKQRLGEASGAVYIQGYDGHPLRDWYNGKMPEAKMLDAKGLMQAAILEGQSVGQAKGRTNHGNKVKTTTIGNKTIQFLPYEIGLAPTKDNIANVYNSRASKLAEQFGADVTNPTVQRLINQGLTEGLSRSYKTGEETFQGTSSNNDGGAAFNFNFGSGRSVPQGLTKTQWLVQLTDQDAYYTDDNGKTQIDTRISGRPTQVYQDEKGNYYIKRPSFRKDKQGKYVKNEIGDLIIDWNAVPVGKNLKAFNPFSLESEYDVTSNKYKISRRYGPKTSLVHPWMLEADKFREMANNDPYIAYELYGYDIPGYYGDLGVTTGNTEVNSSIIFGGNNSNEQFPNASDINLNE